MFDLLRHHMADFFAHRMFVKHHQLATINLLGGAFTSMINTDIAFDILPVCCGFYRCHEKAFAGQKQNWIKYVLTK